jgi:hypothetical protein
MLSRRFSIVLGRTELLREAGQVDADRKRRTLLGAELLGCLRARCGPERPRGRRDEHDFCASSSLLVERPHELGDVARGNATRPEGGRKAHPQDIVGREPPVVPAAATLFDAGFHRPGAQEIEQEAFRDFRAAKYVTKCERLCQSDLN